MDKELLKKKLHEQIDAMDDERALQMLHEAALEYSKAEDIEDELTPEQLERLKKSFKQSENGNTVSHEEAQKRIKEWLTK
jgi:predicted transcriptional regulator